MPDCRIHKRVSLRAVKPQRKGKYIARINKQAIPHVFAASDPKRFSHRLKTKRAKTEDVFIRARNFPRGQNKQRMHAPPLLRPDRSQFPNFIGGEVCLNAFVGKGGEGFCLSRASILSSMAFFAYEKNLLDVFEQKLPARFEY